jgi:hypothetical protein
MDTPRTATITMRVRNALKKRLEKMARSTGCRFRPIADSHSGALRTAIR